tara:strand:- start:2754 stop:3785 length:1032 start_codon:yes stop_codon:yes gene_type:complete
MPQGNKIKLSIIIPVYNEDKYILKLLDELKFFFNSNENEIIIVDDGSTDNSLTLANQYKYEKDYNFLLKVIKIKNNSGKGNAIQIGIKETVGEYILLMDADLELDTKDSKEMSQMIKKNKDIKCIFGSRYLSGKLKKNNYFFNNLIGKFNSLIFNIFFSQSISDVHCGLKILHRDVVNNINLSVKDFGIEIDLASQIVRNNFFIYEYGVSYYFRTKKQGKKITWIDGLKSFYYLLKVRFFDNSIQTNLSILYSSIYMSYVGSYFGMGNGKTLFVIIFFIFGAIIGINFKLIPTSIIFLFIFLGSFFGSGNGTTLSVLIFFILGIIFTKYIKKLFIKTKFNYFF